MKKLHHKAKSSLTNLCGVSRSNLFPSACWRLIHEWELSHSVSVFPDDRVTSAQRACSFWVGDYNIRVLTWPVWVRHKYDSSFILLWLSIILLSSPSSHYHPSSLLCSLCSLGHICEHITWRKLHTLPFSSFIMCLWCKQKQCKKWESSPPVILYVISVRCVGLSEKAQSSSMTWLLIHAASVLFSMWHGLFPPELSFSILWSPRNSNPHFKMLCSLPCCPAAVSCRATWGEFSRPSPQGEERQN